MLGVFSNNAPDGVDKSLGLTQVLTKEGFKFFASDGNVCFIPHFPLVLLPAKQGNIFEENCGKWYTISTLGPNGGKMVLTLLEEIIALQVSFTPIYI